MEGTRAKTAACGDSPCRRRILRSSLLVRGLIAPTAAIILSGAALLVDSVNARIEDGFGDNSFRYGLSTVYFENGRVVRWENSAYKELKVRMQPSADDPEHENPDGR
jgi:hypothetical protein